MAIRTLDTFTGTSGAALNTRTGETGATWVYSAGYPTDLAHTPLLDSTGGRVRGSANAGSQMFTNGVATTDGDYAEATVDVLTANTGFGIWIRSNPSLAGVSRGYLAAFIGGTVRILRQDNTTFIQVGGAAVSCPMPVANGVVCRITASGVGSAVTLTASLNGTTVFTGVDDSVGRLTMLGGTGLYFEESGSDTQNIHVTKLEMRDAAAEDIVAPTLSAPTGAASGSNSATGSVTTDEGNGILYCLTNTAAAATAAAVIAGGTTQTVSSTGTKSFAIPGLAAATQYYNHFVQVDGAGNTSTVANSAAFTTAAAAVVTSFAIPQYADAVREGVSAASGTVITTTGAAPAQFRTFAAAFATGVRGIPVRVEEADSGNWVLCDATLGSATQLTITRIYGSSVGFTMPTFGSGAKSVFCVLPASQIVRKDFIDLAAYGADPTFNNDSTQAWQASINDAYALGISVIRASYGRYKIAGPLVQNVGGYNPNSQLYIPQTREGAPNKTVFIQGIAPPNFEAQILRDVPLVTNGVILESTIYGSGTNPAILAMVPGNTNDTPGWQFNYTNIGLKNLFFRTNVTAGANSMGGVNLRDAAQLMALDRVGFGINMGLLSSPNPINVNSTALAMPKVNNHGLMNGGMVYISGYTNGISANEHTCFLNATIIGCYNALVLEQNFHASHIGLLTVEGCVNGIVINGDHGISIGTFDTEHLAVAGSWYIFEKDIKFVSGPKNRKVVIQLMHIVAANVGIDDSLFTTNAAATHYKIIAGAGAN